jgi:hypothetical protein
MSWIFFDATITATPAQAPIQAPRVDVSASATTSAGMTTAGHVRSREPNTRRATAAQITSISTPE